MDFLGKSVCLKKESSIPHVHSSFSAFILLICSRLKAASPQLVFSFFHMSSPPSPFDQLTFFLKPLSLLHKDLTPFDYLLQSVHSRKTNLLFRMTIIFFQVHDSLLCFSRHFCNLKALRPWFLPPPFTKLCSE